MIQDHLLLCLLALSAGLLAGTVAREAIDGGQLVTIDNEFIYQVSLRIHGHNHSCGGAIISEKCILTAAHCVVNDDGQFIHSHMSILAGTHDLRSTDTPAKIFQVKKIYVPNVYFETMRHSIIGDIAILKLSEIIAGIWRYPNRYSTVETDYPNRNVNYTDRTALISGWGQGQQLHYAEARVLSQRQCEGMHRNRVITDGLTICAKVKHKIGSKLRGACHGDDGGPLFIDNNYVVGILSQIAPECDEMPTSAIYTRVSGFRLFITMAMHDHPDNRRRTYLPPIH